MSLGDHWLPSLPQTMKDIPGVPRPHIVEDFIRSLQERMSTVGDRTAVELPQVRRDSLVVDILRYKHVYIFSHVIKEHFANCLSQLSCMVLAREKECYQL